MFRSVRFGWRGLDIGVFSYLYEWWFPFDLIITSLFSDPNILKGIIDASMVTYNILSGFDSRRNQIHIHSSLSQGGRVSLLPFIQSAHLRYLGVRSMRIVFELFCVMPPKSALSIVSCEFELPPGDLSQIGHFIYPLLFLAVLILCKMRLSCLLGK